MPHRSYFTSSQAAGHATKSLFAFFERQTSSDSERPTSKFWRADRTTTVREGTLKSDVVEHQSSLLDIVEMYLTITVEVATHAFEI